MAIDPNIALGVKPIQLESPLNQLAQVMQIKGLQNQNRIADMQFEQKQQADEEARNVNALYAQFTGPDGKIDRSGLLQAAAKSRLGSKIPAWQKQFAESDKAQAELEKDKAALVDAKIKQSRQLLDGVSTPEQLIAWHEGNHTDPVLGEFLKQRGITAQQSREKIMQALQTPGGLERLINESKLGAEKFIELNKPQYQSVNTGNAMSIVALPGLGGSPQTVREAPILQSEQSRAEIASREREAARNRDVTMRGQDLTDARVRETNEIARTSQASKTPAEKPLTEGQSKALLFGTRMQAAEDVLTKLAESGTEVSIPGSRSGYGVGSVVNAIQPQQRQQLDQAKRDFINAVLRRESGAVISPEEFDNAERQYFPQPGEGPQQRAQKKANRELATRGILAEVPDSARRVEDIRAKPAKPQMNPQDAQALEWANANPNDPRAAQIKQRLGQ